MSLTRFDMMLCNCIDFEFSFYYRYLVVWSIRMESDSISNAAAIADKENDIADKENDIAKRVHTSEGDTPGKPKNKAPRLSRKKNPRSSRALFQSPGKSPKVKR